MGRLRLALTVAVRSAIFARLARVTLPPNPDPQGYDQALKRQTLKLYLEGTSLRAIGPLLNINHQTVSNWVNTSSAELPEEVSDQPNAETIEIDELFTFITDKKTKST